jgi:hypothetical protein
MWTQKNNKVYFFKRKWGSGKFFRNEKALMKTINENSVGEIFEFEFKNSYQASEYFKNTIKERERDTQLKVILGESDKYEEAILNFKSKLEELGESNRQRNSILEKLRVHGCNKDTFKDIINNYRLKNFILMSVSDTVEWYEVVLRCHNFKSLPGKNFSEKAFDNFKAAKELIKKKK